MPLLFLFPDGIRWASLFIVWGYLAEFVALKEAHNLSVGRTILALSITVICFAAISQVVVWLMWLVR